MVPSCSVTDLASVETRHSWSGLEQVLTRGEPPRVAFPRESCLQHYGRLETSVVGSCFFCRQPWCFLKKG